VGYSVPLEALRRTDEPLYGGKSANLGELLAAQIPVPPGFALSTEAFQAFVRESGVQATVDQAMHGVGPGDLEAIGAASGAISKAMRSALLPRSVAEELGLSYRTLEEHSGLGAPAVAVRSSAVGEDSEEATFAGQQETYLWVRGADHVCAAVRDCWISLYSQPAISYRTRLSSAHRQPAMGVTVQLMVDAAVSGVMFTCNPVSGDRSTIAIDASWGLGLGVVSGEVTPDHYLVSKVTGEVVRERIPAKPFAYAPDAEGHGTIRIEVPPELREARCLTANSLPGLLDLGRRVEAHFGSPQDVEWAIAQDGSLFAVQTRPITTLRRPEPRREPADAISLVMRTFGARKAEPPCP
jgi:pyruvate,water dikinase